MLKNLILTLALVIAVGTARELAVAQTVTDAQVQAAIDRGSRAKIKDVGLSVRLGGGARFLRDWAADTLNPLHAGFGEAWSQFALQIYTPISWIEYQAVKAASRRASFDLSKVTADMRRPVLRAFARPYAQAVVIRDEQKSTEPAASQPCTEVTYFDGKASTNCTMFEFPLSEIADLLTSEFIITVQLLVTPYGGSPRMDAEDIQTRDFKVERKYLNRLPM